jgi:hypothetical protein
MSFVLKCEWHMAFCLLLHCAIFSPLSSNLFDCLDLMSNQQQGNDFDKEYVNCYALLVRGHWAIEKIKSDQSYERSFH